MVRKFTRREAILATAAVAAPPARAQEGRGRDLPANMRRGFNLPDQAPARADFTPNVETLKTLYRMGMTHIRLPVVTEYMMPSFSGPATISSAMDDLSHALDLLLGIGYRVSVDMHSGGDFEALYRRDAKAAHGALLLNWPILARHLSRWPSDRICVELLNEPPTTDDVWRPFAEKLARAVRAQLAENVIVVGPAPSQRIEALAAWTPFADPNIVYAVHYYDPMPFTHQGADWDRSSPFAGMAGVPFPAPAGDPSLSRLAAEAQKRGEAETARELREMAARSWTAETIAAQFAPLRAWSAQHGAPVIVNEFGALRGKAARSDRLAWLAAVRRAAEQGGFGWAHWDYATGFGLLNEDRTIDRGVIQALLGN